MSLMSCRSITRERRIPLRFLATCAALLTVAGNAPAQENPFANLNWTPGPAVAKLGDVAEIKVPEGYQFLGATDTQKLLEAMKNPTSGNELGFVTSTAEGSDWFAVFEIDDIGYIKDDDKGELDPDAMLEAIKQGSYRSNSERANRGWPTLNITGWEKPPAYNTETNNLEWAIRAESEGQPLVNYNTRLLGRSGVMEVALVVDPQGLPAALPEFKNIIAAFGFTTGHKYAEFRSGDKMAEYGLAALVTGGAAAMALKTGLFQKLWKFIVAGVVVLAAGIKRLFGRREPTVPTQP